MYVVLDTKMFPHREHINPATITVAYELSYMQGKYLV